MRSCREVTRLITDGSMEEAGFFTKIPIWVHFLMCVHCRRFPDQIRALGKAARAHSDSLLQKSRLREGLEDRILERLIR